jgi:hypothetical protein
MEMLLEGAFKGSLDVRLASAKKAYKVVEPIRSRQVVHRLVPSVPFPEPCHFWVVVLFEQRGVSEPARKTRIKRLYKRKTQQLNVRNIQQLNKRNTQQMNVRNTQQVNKRKTQRLNKRNAQQLNMRLIEQMNEKVHTTRRLKGCARVREHVCAREHFGRQYQVLRLTCKRDPLASSTCTPQT